MMYDVGALVVSRSPYELTTGSGQVLKYYARGMVISWDDVEYRLLVLWYDGPDKGKPTSRPERSVVRDPAELRSSVERARLTRDYTARKYARRAKS